MTVINRSFLRRYLGGFVFLTCLLLPISINASPVTPQASRLSSYAINQSVTYKLHINWTLTHVKSAAQSYTFKSVRMNDRDPESSLTPLTPEYQQIALTKEVIQGYDSMQKDTHDDFDNTYDIMRATMTQGEQISYIFEYDVTLNEIIYDETVADGIIGAYNTNDEIHDLYCEKSEKYYEKTNSTLIAFSNSLVNQTDNPLVKAKKIYNGVVNLLDYEVQVPERGASWAYGTHKGDCSEYSDLMITLLRIQGIPARKVTGFLLSNQAALRPANGSSYTFSNLYPSDPNEIDDALGHAWVEYYVPNLGWIACDPTWGEGGVDYFNQIDYMRFNLNVGAWFEAPDTNPAQDVSEFPFYPLVVTTDHSAYIYEYNIHVEVENAQLTPVKDTTTTFSLKNIPSFDLTLITLCLIGVSAVLILLNKTRRNLK